MDLMSPTDVAQFPNSPLLACLNAFGAGAGLEVFLYLFWSCAPDYMFSSQQDIYNSYPDWVDLTGMGTIAVIFAGLPIGAMSGFLIVAILSALCGALAICVACDVCTYLRKR